MRIRLVPSSVGEASAHQFLVSCVINDTLCIDAGCIGFTPSLEEQTRIRHLLISHTHFDHLASLPIFLENVYDGTPHCVCVHGSETVLECLRRDVFNDRLWPDFVGLSTEESAFLTLHRMESGKTIELEGLRITPVEMNHTIPTLGFIVEDETSAVVMASDTGPTDELWERANRMPNLKAVFLEATFPESLRWLAGVAKHLTPSDFARECAKLDRQPTIVAVHLKARYQKEVAAELAALGMPNLILGQPGHVYEF